MMWFCFYILFVWNFVLDLNCSILHYCSYSEHMSCPSSQPTHISTNTRCENETRRGAFAGRFVFCSSDLLIERKLEILLNNISFGKEFLFVFMVMICLQRFSILVGWEHVNLSQAVQKVEIKCRKMKLNWLTGESWKRKKTKWRTSYDKVTTF